MTQECYRLTYEPGTVLLDLAASQDHCGELLVRPGCALVQTLWCCSHPKAVQSVSLDVRLGDQ